MFLIHCDKFFQSIEAQDPSHQCVEYWNHKEAISKSSSNNSQGDFNSKLFGFNLTKLEEKDNIGESCHSFEEMKLVLEGFLKKATPDELRAMHKLFCSDAQLTRCRAAFLTLIEEIQKRMLNDPLFGANAIDPFKLYL